MPSPSSRASLLTKYVRWRIEQWEAAGKNLKDLEVVGGRRVMSKGYASKVKHGTSGVESKSGEGFARAFGLRDYLDLQLEARKWAQTEEGKAALAGTGSPSQPLEPARKEAIEFAQRHETKPEAVAEALRKYGHLKGQSAMWWIERFSEEQRLLAAENAKSGFRFSK